MHTTPPSPVDMARVFPELVPFARTTIRLHPRRGAPTAVQSSIGGPLLWPADEPWPTCEGIEPEDHFDEPGLAEVPLVPVAQLLADDVPDLPFPSGTDVLQVLWCPFDHEPWDVPRPQLRWRRRADIGPRLATMPPPDVEASARYLPGPCVIDPEKLTEYPGYDLPHEVRARIRETAHRLDANTGWQYDTDLAVASGIKVGGYPGWTQFPDWPVCGCGIVMTHLLTVTGWEFGRGDEKRWVPVEDRPAMAGWDLRPREDHPWLMIQNPTGLMIGDGGGIYLFVCTSCPGRPLKYRFDCA